MGSKKKDLEIIYNLEWRNKPANGSDKALVIGMYDVPATTLNWEIFKSYLLKNSGMVGEDVKVSYITNTNKEFLIESQTDFQIALYAFRRRARMGDIVNLMLEPLNAPPVPSSRKSARYQPEVLMKKPKNLNDAETQSENNENVSIASTCSNMESPPEWFILYMNQFKKNIMEEVSATVSGIVSNIKCHSAPQPAYHSRKSKVESSKRMRKLQPLMVESSHETKDLIKSLRIEGKLERKLEKLEHKTKKIREKKLALFTKSSDSEAGHSSSKSRSVLTDREADVLQMDAAVINAQAVVPHMLGGEIYLHQWEVMNTGKLIWPSKTTLNFTWGSKALKPLEAIISVPSLKPGESGTIAVRLQVPNEPGLYECYWHLHHKERRFGQWLGCQVIVDDFDLKGNKSVLETKFPRAPSSRDIQEAITQYKYALERKHNDITKDEEEENASNHALDAVVRDINARIEDIKLQDPTDTNCSSDSDNQSIISLAESNCSKVLPEEFVVVPIPECFKLEVPIKSEVKENNLEEGKTDEIDVNFDNNNNTGEIDQNGKQNKDEDSSSCGSQKSDIVLITLPENDDQNAEYAYVIVDGQRLPIPKKMIKSEYLEAAEKMKPDDPSTNSNCPPEVPAKESFLEYVTSSIKPEAVSADSSACANLNSHCSAAGSCFSDITTEQQDPDKNLRLFIFPQSNPGYEVVYPTDNLKEMAEQPPTGYTWENSATQYTYPFPEPSNPQQPFNIQHHDQNPFTNVPEYVPNYQQTPVEQRTPPVQVDTTVQPDSTNTATTTAPPVAPQQPPQASTRENAMHILPETLVSGAVNVASSAINTARSVINMIRPQENPGHWVNGHWVSTSQDSSREAALQALAEMGFWDRDLNATLLARYNDDLSRVVAELVQ